MPADCALMPSGTAALTRTFLEHRDTLFAFALALCRDAAAAEEVFQEVGVQVLAEAGKGTRPDDALAWMRGIVRHQAAAHYRRENRHRAMHREVDELADAIDLAFAEAAGRNDLDEHMRFLRECLPKLGRRARELIDRHYRDRLGLDDIAGAVGWHRDAVKVGLSKARRVLGDCIRRKLARVGGGRP